MAFQDEVVLKKNRRLICEGLYFFVAKQTDPYFGALLKAMIFFDPKNPEFSWQILQVWSFLQHVS